MKTDLKSIATQLRTFFRTSRYEVYFKKCEADMHSASRNLFYSDPGQNSSGNQFYL